MSLTKAQKAEMIQDLTQRMKDAKSVIFADYQGLTVEEIKALRAKLRAQGASFQISKKTLIKIAAAEAGYPEVSREVVEGPIGAAFSMEDEIAAAKILNEFSKTNKNLKLRGGFFEKRVLTVAETKALANLPSKEELLAKLVYLLKSPISGFHGVLNNTLAGFVRVLNAIKEKQGA